MIQVVIPREMLELFGDLRNIHVSVGACLALAKIGKMEPDEALKRIAEQIRRAEEIWRMLAREGI